MGFSTKVMDKRAPFLINYNGFFSFYFDGDVLFLSNRFPMLVSTKSYSLKFNFKIQRFMQPMVMWRRGAKKTRKNMVKFEVFYFFKV